MSWLLAFEMIINHAHTLGDIYMYIKLVYIYCLMYRWHASWSDTSYCNTLCSSWPSGRCATRRQVCVCVRMCMHVCMRVFGCMCLKQSIFMTHTCHKCNGYTHMVLVTKWDVSTFQRRQSWSCTSQSFHKEKCFKARRSAARQNISVTKMSGHTRNEGV